MEFSDELCARIVRLRSNVQNLANGYYWEVAWKNHSLRTNHWYLQTLSRNGERCAEICGRPIIDLTTSFVQQHGRKPEVLDVGCGPISSLAYLVYHDLADVVGVDPLSREYTQLLAQYRLKSPVNQLVGCGEELEDVLSDRQFDIVYCRNALDHGLAPMQTWLNMFRRLRMGGYLLQSHSIQEATKQDWKQLHQFNLFPDEDKHVWLEDEQDERFCLTRDIALKLCRHWESRWFTSLWQKVSDEVGPAFLSAANRQLLTALLKRSRWGLKCENLIFEMTTLIDHKSAPLDIRICDNDGSEAEPEPDVAAPVMVGGSCWREHIPTKQYESPGKANDCKT